MANFFTRLLTAGEGKQFREYESVVEQVNAFEPLIEPLTDDALRAKTDEFRSRLEAGEELDDLLPEAFAVVREAARRTLGMRHFDVQIIGGIVLHRGNIAEMKTGEGKTLVATLPVYLNALAGKGVHVVTVNDYLAKRDSEWMGQVYRFLGLTVGIVQSGMDPAARKPAYAADVTYGTNTEFGFDYLRDNMVTRAENRVQRGHHYAIVDEVDSILIDEARTPLIISGAGTRSADTYKSFAKIAPRLKIDEDFELDEAKRTVAPTEQGISRVEQLLGIEDLYADPSGQMVNHLQQALKAQYLFNRDVEYVVKDGEVLIVDEFTGRLMVGRRWSDGLHQAVEAKEHVHVREENQTLATITLQNFFRLYEKLAGMTGTAVTEDAEFREIYNLPVVVIPPNRPMVRDDRNDLIYRTIDAKFDAVAEEIATRYAAGQPCLVGTISIENSERLSGALKRRGLPHNVLNAKFHEMEAHIVAQAGRKGSITIATNMAGRGTDIILGGNPEFLADEILRNRGIDPEEATDEQRADALGEAKRVCAAEHEEVVAAGGLAVIGTERHDSRRIDNQLRGRSGRQGDPGVSQFYLSLEDDLMRLFGGGRMDRISAFMSKGDIPEDMPIQAKMVSKAIESAQRQVEAQNFASRKYVLEYDDVMNKQRQVIYAERNQILDGKDIRGRVEEMIRDTVASTVAEFCSEKSYSEEWDWDGLADALNEITGASLVDGEVRGADTPAELTEALAGKVLALYQAKEAEIGEQQMRALERHVMLRVIDARWMNHLLEMDYLRDGIGLRAIGQRDPLVEYKAEAYDAFKFLVSEIDRDFLRTITHIQVTVQPAPEAPELSRVTYTAPTESTIFGGARAQAASQAAAGGGASEAMAAAAAAGAKRSATPGGATVVKDKSDPYANVGRNEPCPCGSGKKYKHCHGANA
ncbi:preprotein translocase subunit SecA [Anaerosoma tenue]|uniref:preprotein translocase subunit SecA n=1 Tax=Anaerosoma tenue TaxID=2933588 RepID=UPI002260C0AA|nr:preprotein translocase subunit SecA [Anaerosoma tenue]MCK8114566.1 preprotein translocase subunit SecA [Anaerosoma tenue]